MISRSTVRGRQVLAALTTGIVMLAMLLGHPAPAAADSGSVYRGFVGTPVKPAPGARTVPFFQSSFVDAGWTYSYSMVGGSPAIARTTEVEVTIVPLRVELADGSVFDSTSALADVLASPIFTPAQFDSGHTQYVDAMRRAEFWSLVHDSAYHLRLDPHPLPTVALRVPAGAAQSSTTIFGAPTARVNVSWFDARTRELTRTLDLDPRGFTVFLTRDLLFQDARGCCVGGYHSVVTASSDGAGHQPVWTYAVANWYTPGGFRFSDTTVLSHELAEWADDPFGSNLVASWISPLPLSQASYGCYRYLETADPTLDVWFTVDGVHHLQDVAFLPWFSREEPSSAIAGRYTYLGTFDSPAERC